MTVQVVPEPPAARMARPIIAYAAVTIVTCPSTTMISAPMLDKEPRGRGITRVKQLLQAGANVAVGQDNIDDPYNAFGDADPLTNGFLTAYAALLSGDEDLEWVVDMLSVNGARLLGGDDGHLSVGATATFNIIGARTVREMFRTRADRLHVVRAGRVVATTRTERALIRAS